MKGLQLVFQDIKAMWKHKHGRIALIFLLVVPLIYSGFFLAGYWNPYGKLDQLPVAVVNLDHGSKMDDKPVEAGEDFVEQLKKQKELDFHFVTAKEANTGLKEGTYYMVVTIPEDFSQNVTTLMDKKPETAKLLYTVNPGKNFVASQISSTAVEKMTAKINASITKVYSEGILSKFQDVSNGLADAGAGAETLHQGTADAKNGTEKLNDGIQDLNDGAQKLQTGSTKLLDGQEALAAGAKVLTSGSQTLHSGMKHLSDAHDSLENGMNEVSKGVEKWSAGNAKLMQGQEQAADTANTLKKQLDAYLKSHPDAIKDQDFKHIVALSEGLSKAAATLHAGQKQLGEGAVKVADGQATVQTGMNAFGDKMAQATSGAKQLNDGSEELANGLFKWKNGFSTLHDGIDSLAGGSSRLASGSTELQDGLAALETGSSKLSTKLNEAADKTASLQYDDSTTSMFSEPVQLVQSNLSEVPNYGTGIAPYFLSLAFYVGGIMASNILPLGRRQNLKVTGTVHFTNKLMLVYVIGLVQALLVDAVVLLGFHLHVASVPVFILSSIIVSFTFMTFILMLVTVFGVVGKFAAVTLLVFQLATCGGTFPGELGMSLLTKIGQFLPMAHSLKELQEVISLGGWENLRTQIWILLAYLVSAAIIGWIASHIQHAKVTSEEVTS
ncbi:YhgE/Pip domain-containing protein [Peribacillus simplex]|uniref:YhgE/Pip domain-containing protein n=1 Tax=Peribacillus simplex TaxID=1478 RepID=UPI0024C1631C|nr:YhgE/Pip domain-containing protein [Peribacillus simplex]WHY55680.1 YhgE/Pip domain-containing protein [Peribacillus simplex]